MRWSIRYQLLVPLLILLVGVVGIGIWGGVASANRAQQHLREEQMRRTVKTLNESSYPLTEQVLEWMKGHSGDDYVVIDRTDKRTTTLREKDFDLPPEAPDSEPETIHLGPPVLIGDETYLCGISRVRRGNSELTLYILYPQSEWRDTLWKAVKPSLLLGIFVGLASIALALWVGQHLTRRIRELVRRTRMIAQGDFRPMPLPRGNDELRDLSRSVNEMAERLAQLQETVQKTERLRLLGQVSGGLAHQLRNGVTGARLAVQLHARECHADGDTEVLEVALRQLSLMEANLKRFLDPGTIDELRKEPCSIATLVDETVALLRPQCLHAHIDLRWRKPEDDGMILGDTGLLSQLLNVVTNAMDAAGPEGWVELTMRFEETGEAGSLPAASQVAWKSAARMMIVEVADSGPGPGSSVAGRLFEPFVTSKPEGVGLGLAAARQVAEAHGGRIDWRRQADRTCFRIELPLNADGVKG